MSVEIASLDPGITIGVATLESDGLLKAFQICPDDYPHPHELLFDLLSNLSPKKLVYESFLFRQGMEGAVYKGLEYIGVAELYAQLKCLKIIKISPSDGKGFWDNRKLNAIGAYQSRLPHGMDAMRVLLRYRMKSDVGFMPSVLPIFKENL